MSQGKIKQLPAFPAPPLFYADDVAQDIVAQFAFRNNSPQNEAAPLESMVLSGATISEGQLRTTALANTYQFHCPYFGAGDFTVECKITFTQWGSSAGHYILCQHAAGDKVTVRNSWMFRASNTGTNKFFQWIENRMGVTTYNTAESAPFFVQLNKEYHVVAERFAGVTRIFVDGFLYGQFESAEPLVESPDNVFSESWDLTGFGRCLRKIRDIRIAKRAMYKGKVPRPSIRLFKHTNPLVLKSWSKPLASDGHGMQSAGVTLDGVSYIFGGRVGAGIAAVSAVSIHDGKSVKPVAIMPEALVTHTAALYGREVYIFGGFSGTIHDANASNKLLVFNVDTFAFRYGTPCPVTMTSPGSAIAGDTLYVGGGYPNTVEGTVITAYYAYHIPTDTWTQLPDHPESFAISGLFAHHGKIYTFGGERSAATVHSNKVHCYDPLSGTWENITPIYGPSGRSCHGVSFDKDSFVIVGGRVGGYAAAPSAEVWSFNTVTKSWTRLADMLTPVAFCTVLARNGMLHVTDGYYTNSVTVPGGYLLS